MRGSSERKGSGGPTTGGIFAGTWDLGHAGLSKRLKLVGGLDYFLFFHLLGIPYSQLTNSYFSEE